MAKSKVTKIKVHSAGVVAILKDPKVASYIRGRGHSVKASLPTGNGEEWIMDSTTGKERARVTIRTGNKAARETAARSGVMQGAIGSGG